MIQVQGVRTHQPQYACNPVIDKNNADDSVGDPEVCIHIRSVCTYVYIMHVCNLKISGYLYIILGYNF